MMTQRDTKHIYGNLLHEYYDPREYRENHIFNKWFWGIIDIHVDKYISTACMETSSNES